MENCLVMMEFVNTKSTKVYNIPLGVNHYLNIFISNFGDKGRVI